MHIPPFSYMRWTKVSAGGCRLDLSASGVPTADLPPIQPAADYRVRPNGDGDPVNEMLIGRRYAVPKEHVLFVPGTTMGNFLLLFALVERGDRVLVEMPAYENLPGLVRLLGAEPVPLPRPAEENFAVDPARVEAAFANGIRVAILTDLHNPSGVRLPEETIEALRESARRHGATIVLDEVYRDFLPPPVGTAYRPDDASLLVTSSLTKVYGMGALRTGWLLAPPDLRRRAAELVDYLTVLPPAASARAAEFVLRDPERYREAGRALAARGRVVFEEWAAAREDVRWAPPAGGLVAFPRFDGIEDARPLCDWLREERDTLVVPGGFFDAPAHVRLSFAPEPEVLREGLAAVAEGVEKFRGTEG